MRRIKQWVVFMLRVYSVGIYSLEAKVPPMLETVVIESKPAPRHAVIWMHGLGADAHDFEPIVPELLRANWPGVRFVFPNAPMRPVTVNGGYVMRAWYDIAGNDIAARQDEPGLKASRTAIEALIGAQVKLGVESEHIYLAGFSQGAAMSLYVALRHATALGGVIALSGYLPLGAQTASEAHDANLKTPIFMGHGTQDQVVPEALGRRSADALKGWGYEVDYRTYPMAHSVSPQEIADVSAWLGARLSR